MPSRKQSKVRHSFDDETLVLLIDRIAPIKVVDPAIRQSRKYLQVEASIKAVGVIEPVVVCRESPRSKTYVLVDGHIRHDIMKRLEHTDCVCLVTTDMDTFTYNHKVQYVQPIQQHRMILRAVESGVSESAIAKALSIDVAIVRDKRKLLDGICPEAVKLIERRDVPASTINVLRQAKPLRQIKMAELMDLTNKFTSTYARFLILASRDDELVDPDRTNGRKCSADDLARLESETRFMHADLKALEGTYGENMLHLVVLAGHIKSLVENKRIRRYLAKHYSDYLIHFDRIIEMPEISAAEGGTDADVQTSWMADANQCDPGHDVRGPEALPRPLRRGEAQPCDPSGASGGG